MTSRSGNGAQTATQDSQGQPDLQAFPPGDFLPVLTDSMGSPEPAARCIVPASCQGFLPPSLICLLMEGNHPGCKSRNANTAMRAPAVGGRGAQGGREG